MNWVIVLLFAAGCGICDAQSTTVRNLSATTFSTSNQSQEAFKGLVPVPPGASCPIRTCGRNEVLKVCGLCYDNTCSGRSVQVCSKVCYCGCYCRIGFVRTTPNGRCVLPKQCPILPIV
ncbi:cysteine-rich venom protein 6-like [Anopheles stephensi]|uniref:cysteine-rich venom protein 6-like n=1 Tax=Anopheles stephensi TaxID=30069 RepID=UPI0016587539|nr:cysteine-rich venom protein 6-like [Anopheles stephensi]